jgi:hypothetical protein
VIALALVLVSGAGAALDTSARPLAVSITISASSGATQVQQGGSASFSVTATNVSGADVSDVWISNMLGLHWSSESMGQTGGPAADQCEHPNNFDTNCHWATFPANATVTFSASATASPSATIGEILNSRFFVFLTGSPSGATDSGSVVSLQVVAPAPPPPPPPPQRVTLGVAIIGPGTVSCGVAPCNGSIDLGTSVTLTAAPAGSAVFSGWSGACSGNTTTCTIVMDSSKTVTATFDSLPPPPSPPICHVSNLRGLTLAAARAALAAGNCYVAVSSAFSAKVRKGRVVRQSAPPGTKLPSGSVVHIVVSRGRR